jgi:5-methylcytosine-specific restriction endonuclease McrA
MNKARRSFASHNSRALKVYGLGPEFTFEEFEAWYVARMGEPCPCGAVSNSIDHVIPLARGGRHSLSNFECLCRSCNSRKCAWLAGEFRVYPWDKPGFPRPSGRRGPRKRKKAELSILRPAPGSIFYLNGCAFRAPE